MSETARQVCYNAGRADAKLKSPYPSLETFGPRWDTTDGFRAGLNFSGRRCRVHMGGREGVSGHRPERRSRSDCAEKLLTLTVDYASPREF